MGLHILVVYIIKRVKSREKGAYRMQRGGGGGHMLAVGVAPRVNEAAGHAVQNARGLREMARYSLQTHADGEAVVAQLERELASERRNIQSLTEENEIWRRRAEGAERELGRLRWQAGEDEQTIGRVQQMLLDERRRFEEILRSKSDINPSLHAEVQEMNAKLKLEIDDLKARLRQHERKQPGPVNPPLPGHGHHAAEVSEHQMNEWVQANGLLRAQLQKKSEEENGLRSVIEKLNGRIESLEHDLRVAQAHGPSHPPLTITSTPSALFLKPTEKTRLEEFRQSISDCQSGPDTYRVPLDVMQILVHVLQKLGIPR
jgi:DNA repair exonuclease SbcCD ATPase subunit